jgi:Cu(I)/Ag(I) efflux system membrane fusion protein/cobalt-zinc-cadmium efflux system membrane fusion protein
MKSKNRLLLFILIALSALLVLGGCSSGEKSEAITEPDPAQAAQKQLYTCGMHPNVISEEPGTCPICKMDLTPMKTEMSKPDSVKSEKSGEKKIKYWVAPMDPTYIRDEPGKSPMGMDLVPVYEDDGNGASSGTTVRIDPVVVQNMGIRTAHAHRMDLGRSVRILGEVDVAEDSVSVVNLRYSGWIEKIHVDQTGAYVKKGQPLFRIYSPELVQAQQEYIQALSSTGADSPLTKSARTRLELAGAGSWLVKALAGKTKPFKTIAVPSPQNGYVLHKNVVEGSKVVAGQDLYRIGNLASIWVNVEVYEFDAPWINTGDPARMELSFEKGKTYDGKVGYVYPTLDKKTRTLKARLEFPNPGLALKPGMFATVWIEVQKKADALAIPTEAILHSGQRQLVFVSIGDGKYEPREITTGLVGDDHMTEVLTGLSEHEIVVTSGQFLLDSESQLQEAVAKLLADRLEAKTSKDNSNADKDTKAVTTYWTCPMDPQVVQDGPGTCPICKMDLVEKKK